jgi:methionyl aminopeptidase
MRYGIDVSFWRRLFGGGDDSSPADMPGESRLLGLQAESRQLGLLLGQIFTKVEPTLIAGTTTAAIDAAVKAQISELRVSSSFLELGFPGRCSTSIDHEIINAPPSKRKLEIGQLLKLQIGIKGKQTYAMQGWTYAIGPRDDEAARLMQSGIEALHGAVSTVRSGTRVGAIGAAIQTRIEAAGFTVNRHFVGHGVDTRPHTDPQILGFGVAAHGPRLRPGAILSINVIAHAGTFDCEVLDDNWTAVAKDGRRSVQFGQMVIVTDGPAEIVTTERTLWS